MAEEKTVGKAVKGGAPTEDDILKELRRREQRKTYMQSDKTKDARKRYMKKRYAESKALRDYMKDHPEEVERIKKQYGLS